MVVAVSEELVEQARIRLDPGMHIHLVGIGGSGMSAIAWVLLGHGFTVSGSDMQTNDVTRALDEAGATVYQGHDGAHIAGADALVISSAIPESNAEVVAAEAARLPVLKRADFLGALMASAQGVAVAGSHGKTTTTSLIAHILLEAQRDPTVIVGGVLPTLGRAGRAGQSDLFVVEADEYDYMFLGLQPQVEVITNIEHDHPDIFPTPDVYRDAFNRFVQRLPAGGTLIACADDPGVRGLLSEIERTDIDTVTYGLDENGERYDLTAVDVRSNRFGGSDFVVLADGETIGLARLRLPGKHNIRNALAAIAACRTLGVTFGEMYPALADFGGVGRRFQVLGEVRGVTVVDDYAHHPTEIRATLAAARQRYPGRRLWAVWQPHTYSRTKLLLEEFAASFDEADRVTVLDIYPSRERDTLGIDSGLVVSQMTHDDAHYIGAMEAAVTYILDRIRPGDVLLTLGAGDGDQVGRRVLARLEERVRS